MSDTTTLQQKNTGQPPRIERLIYIRQREHTPSMTDCFPLSTTDWGVSFG